MVAAEGRGSRARAPGGELPQAHPEVSADDEYLFEARLRPGLRRRRRRFGEAELEGRVDGGAARGDGGLSDDRVDALGGAPLVAALVDENGGDAPGESRGLGDARVDGLGSRRGKARPRRGATPQRTCASAAAAAPRSSIGVVTPGCST